MADERSEWSSADFDTMSWHDVHVHGFRFSNPQVEKGAMDLVLDIDYILEWLREESQFSFDVAPARLTFRGVFGLRLSLDYATPTAGVCPFSIGAIRRTEKRYSDGYATYRWSIDVNWPDGSIEFDSPGFDQCLTGLPRRSTRQWLDESERV